MRATLLFVLISLVLALSGCGKGESASNSEPIIDPAVEEVTQRLLLLEDEDASVRVYETPGWQLEQEAETEQFQATFQHEKLKAIMTTVSNEMPLAEIKRDVKVGAGKVTIIEEKDDYLAFQSDRKESIRSDVFIEKGQADTLVMIFMTPVELYEGNKEHIEALRNNTERN